MDDKVSKPTPLRAAIAFVLVSLTGGITIVAREMVKGVPQGKVDLGAAALALLGLWAWEGLQLFTLYGAFDWHDLAWTVPGVLIGYFAASRILGRRTRS